MSVSGGVVHRGSVCCMGRDNAGRGKPVGAEDSRESRDVWDTGVVHDKFYTEAAGATATDEITADREGIDEQREDSLCRMG